ncbi:MAG: hypothetical protein LBP83_00595 [Dysgonamonadaceae bacterium]|jgi:hypothetical protein|nr:hypothetical protein [Dysgonamonadaceae bacterium]
MKQLLIIIFLSVSTNLFSQIDYCEVFSEANDEENTLRAGETYHSNNGTTLPTQGTLRGLTVFVNIIYDQTPQNDPHLNSTSTIWPADTKSSINACPPVYMLNLFDVNTSSSGQYNGVVTRLYAESSFNQLILLSDFMVVNIKQSQISPNNPGSSFNEIILRNSVITYINNNGGLQAIYGHNNLVDYDKIKTSGSGLPKTFLPDSKIDFINFLCRNTTKTYGGLSGSSGLAGGVPSDSIIINGQRYGYNTGIYASVGPGDITEHQSPILIHEFAHLLLGSNAFHTSGGTTDNTLYENTFIGKQEGYGLFGHSILSCNAFERWRLGWRGASNNAYPVASNNADSDVGKFTGEKTFVLRDFVTYGDAIRIKLPYKDNTQASNQYIWLENHQCGENNKIDGYVYPGSNGCRDMEGTGIYAYYQVGKDILESTNRKDVYPTNDNNNMDMDNLRMLSAEGNYNVTYEDQQYKDCLGWVVRPRFSYVSPNPLSGINDQNEVYAYNASASSIQYSHKSYFGIKSKNNTLYTGLPYLGDQFDAFVPNPEIKMDISTNPAPVNTTTCYSIRNGGSMTVVSSQRNTRKIYLTGLNIRMIDTQPGSTGMKSYTVKIRWDDYDVKQNVYWAGDIVLKERLNLLSNKLITLEQNKTPNQLTRDSVSGFFAPPTKFTCEGNATINLAPKSALMLKDKSSLIMESGAIMNIQDSAEVIVKSGSTLMVQDGANLNTYGTGRIVAEPGSTLVLPINGKDEIDCRETEFSLAAIANATYNWTASSNIEIVSGKTTSKVKVKGKSYNANSWVRVAVTYNKNGYIKELPVAVNIPDQFVLTPDRWAKLPDGNIQMLIQAIPLPEGVKADNCTYSWRAKGGTIFTGFDLVDPSLNSASTSEGDIPSGVLEMMNKAILQAKSEVSGLVEGDSVQVKQYASAGTDQSSSRSAVYEVSTTTSEGETSAEYVSVETDGSAVTSVNSIVPGVIGPVKPIKTQSFVILTYTPGTMVIVGCEITGCNKSYSATLTIMSWKYSCSYTPSTRSIRLDKDQSSSDEGVTHTYQVQLYNDQGYIRTTTFTSNETTVLIPLTGLPNGNYYINVLDEQNCIVERKFILAY